MPKELALKKKPKTTLKMIASEVERLEDRIFFFPRLYYY